MSNNTSHTNRHLLWQLFFTFFKIGGFTFGGGWAMISIIKREVVERHHWISEAEFLDLLAIAQSLPGILAVNISVVVGDKLRQLRGSIVSAAGVIIPCFVIILAIAIFLTPELITTNPTLTAIFKGIRPAVVALIVTPVITSARAAHIGWSTCWIPILVAALIWSRIPFISNPILFISIGGLVGWYQLARARGEIKPKGGRS